MHDTKGRLWPVMATMLLVATPLVATSSRVIHSQDPASASPADAALKAALMAEGQVVFGADCTTCHAADGAADIGPALAGNTSMGAKDAVITKILNGVNDMPGFAPTLSDRQVAAVATFIRNSWENAQGVVVESDVKAIRDAKKSAPAAH